ncbi:MAG: aminotransferase class V-fold PLP-dependent enzyme [Planctomycetota bacterium]
MLTRRGFLTLPAVAMAGAALEPRPAAAVLARFAALPPQVAPGAVAEDENLWRQVAQSYTVDRSVINLNNGGVSPSPEPVQEAVKRHLDWCNAWPSALALLGSQQPQVEAVRQSLARVFGAETEEIAINRNASEGLQACQFGFDLQRGDEILTSDQDYPRMLNAFRQRERREGLVLKTISLPVPAENPEEIVQRFEEAIGPRTRLLLICHMINLTGQVLPVARIVQMARGKGLPVIVDGAHALAHLDFRLGALKCDYYASSLHKWLGAPHGTGLLYVRKDKIAGLWPLMAAAETQANDIRKFEELGTRPLAPALGIAQALDFHRAMGAERKLARLVFLRDRWARSLIRDERVKLSTSLKPGLAGGLATVRIEGVPTDKLHAFLWDKHRILTTPIAHKDVDGLRISPNVYTTLDEIDRFTEAMESVLRSGLPA